MAVIECRLYFSLHRDVARLSLCIISQSLILKETSVMANNGAVNVLHVMDLRAWELALNVFFFLLVVSFLPCSHLANLLANVKRV